MIKKYKGSIQDEGIINAITDELDKNLGTWYGKDFRLISKIPAVRSFTSSFFLRYAITGTTNNTKHILVKIRRLSTMQSLSEALAMESLHSRVRFEFEALEGAYKFFGDRGDALGAIRPLAYLDNYSAIVTEELPSKTLSDLLLGWQVLFGIGAHIQQLQHVAREAGRWLRIFQFQMNSVHVDRHSLQKINNKVKSYADRLENASHARIQSRTISEMFAKKLEDLRNNSLDMAVSPEDLTSDNILCSNDWKICVIDIKTQDLPLFSPLGQILVFPDVFPIQILTLGVFLNTPIRAYRMAILEGYFGNEPIDNSLLNFFCALHMLDKWVMYEEIIFQHRGLKKIRSSAAVPLIRFYFQRAIKNYLVAHGSIGSIYKNRN